MKTSNYWSREIPSFYGEWPHARHHQHHQHHRRALGGEEYPLVQWMMTPLSAIPYVPSSIYANNNQGLMSRFLDNEFREMQQLERQMMEVQTASDGNTLNFGCNVVGYSPEELQVSVEGDQLVLEGAHHEEHGGQTIHRTFKRQIKLPEGVAKDSIQCDLDDKGNLTVQAERQQKDQLKRRPVPIGFKKAPEAIQDNKKSAEQMKDAGNGAKKGA